MKTIQTTGLFIFLSISAVFAQEKKESESPEELKSTNLELPRIQVFPIEDSNTGWQYELFIKLPPGYTDSVRYPVIYYTDAVWHVEMVSGITEFMMENAILVGISWQKDNEENKAEGRGEFYSRFRDYSIQESDKAEDQAKYQFGQAANHLEFIRNDVFGFVESKYQTDPDNRTYFGYSLGGLFGTYILMSKPDSFTHYVLGSPSLWHANPYLAGFKVKDGFDAKVFISHGTLEDALGKHVTEFVTMLNSRKDKSLSVTYEQIEGTHQTASPLTVVRGVKWLADLTKE